MQSKNQESIKLSKVVICFSLFMALMLFQTSYMRLGTITAATAIFLTIVAFLFRNGKFEPTLKFSKEAAMLFFFLSYLIVSSLCFENIYSNLTRFISLIVLSIILSSFTINEKENNYLKNILIFSSIVYAILIIKFLAENAQSGYIHTAVLIFNTEFDPNYIGIPLVSASAFLLDNILYKKKLVISIIGYGIVLAAIIYTASRGSFLSFMISNLLVLGFFLFNKKIGFSKKVFYFVLPIIIIAILIPIFKENFPLEWERLTAEDYGSGSGRLDLWQRSVSDWWENPIFGRGLGFALLEYNHVTHNTYLQVLSEMGLVGILLFLLLISFFLKRAFRTDKILFCVIVGILFQIMFLDAVDNRCLWVVFCWIAMLPKNKQAFQKQT